jgi:hypothetical protein
MPGARRPARSVDASCLPSRAIVESALRLARDPNCTRDVLLELPAHNVEVYDAIETTMT